MKITLENFKCYSKRTFDLGEKGITLISGFSGQGKTTILEGIMFALFNVGAGTKVIKYGEKTCKVTLETDELTIVRQRKPNCLVVDGKYNDDEAQAIIDKHYGYLFRSVGYIGQNEFTQFIYKSPREKLEFIEHFAYQGIDITQQKKKIKEKVKEMDKQEANLKGQLSVFETELRTLRVDEVDEPKHRITPDDVSKKREHLEHLQTQRTTLECRLQQCNEKKQTVQEKNKQLTTLNEKTDHLNSELHLDKFKNIRQIKRVEKEYNSLLKIQRETQNNKKQKALLLNEQYEIKSKKNKITSFENHLKSFRTKINEKYKTIPFKTVGRPTIDELEQVSTYLKYKEDKKDFDVMMNKERSKLRDNIKKIKSKLWRRHSKKDVSDIIAENQESLADCKRLMGLNRTLSQSSGLDKQLTTLEERSKSLESKLEENNVKECPKCHSHLLFVNGTLTLTHRRYRECKVSQIKKERDMIRHQIKKLSERHLEQKVVEKEKKNILDKYESDYNLEEEKEEIEHELRDMIKYQKIQNELEQSYNMYVEQHKTGQLSTSLQYMKDRLTQTEKQMESYVLPNTYASATLSSVQEWTKTVLQLVELQEESTRITDEMKSVYWDRERFEKVSQHIDELDEVILLHKNIDEKTNECLKSLHALRTLQHKKDLLEQDLSNTKEITKRTRDEIRSLQDDICSLEELYVNRNTLNLEIQMISEKIRNDERIIEEIRKFKEYQTVKQKQDEIKTSIEMIERKRKEISLSIHTHNVYLEKIIEAESLSVMNIAQRLNQHVQTYLDLFFTKDPINVIFKTFKHNKKSKKPHMEIETHYKGYQTKLMSLSGGEQSRVNLAFTLGFCDLYNIDLILLDECTSSLDQELTNQVIECIQEHCSEKLVVLIAHQVVKGQFDNIIHL